MFFTQEDYKKIEDWLYKRTVRDTEFPIADKLDGTESIPIIQKGKNKNVGLNDFVRRVAEMKSPDFYNVSSNHNRVYLELKDAISLVPVEQRKLGLTITYHNEHGNWLIYQFTGNSLNQWSSVKCWTSVIQQAIEEWVFHPDEEDITAVRTKDKQYLKFKDRYCNNDEFIGKGKIILRRNPIGTEACSIDDEDHVINLLTQEMINEPNTVYVVQYDFDLDGKVLAIPEGSTLWFQGGTLNNGTLFLRETSILGAYEFSDMGSVKLFGTFKTGQIMAFLNEEYLYVKDKYFIESSRPGSNEDEDEEVVYIKNPNAYEKGTRYELKWWDGEDWINMLDFIDYVELRSIIDDLIEKHNIEMSECYKYFKQEIQIVNNRIEQNASDILGVIDEVEDVRNVIRHVITSITDINHHIADLESIINNIEGNVTNIDQTIENTVKKYITEMTAGCTAIWVNGNKFVPNDNGEITLPDYPSGGGNGGIADSVRGALTVKTADGTSLGTYNGSEDKTITIPSSGEGGTTIITAKETLTVKQGDTVLGTYDGTEAKTINIPVLSESEDMPLSSLIIQNQKGDTKITYDGTEEKILKGGSLTIKSDYSDKVFESFDSSNVTLDLVPALCGDLFHPIILCAGKFYRETVDKTNWFFSGYQHNLIRSVICALSNCAVDVKIDVGSNGINIVSAEASVSEISGYGGAVITDSTYKSPTMSIYPRVKSANNVQFVGWRLDSSAKEAARSNALTSGNNGLSFHAVIIGYIVKNG